MLVVRANTRWEECCYKFMDFKVVNIKNSTFFDLPLLLKCLINLLCKRNLNGKWWGKSYSWISYQYLQTYTVYAVCFTLLQFPLNYFCNLSMWIIQPIMNIYNICNVKFKGNNNVATNIFPIIGTFVLPWFWLFCNHLAKEKMKMMKA